MATNPPIDATGIVGTDNVAPVYNPNGGWQIHNFNDIYTGQQGAGKVVPLVGDEVHNPVGTTIDIYIVTAIDPLTLIATLTQVTDSNAGNGTGDITPADVLLGTGTTTQPSTFSVYFDDSTVPYGLAVDARYTVNGSMCQTCKIFRGNYLSSSTDVVSLILDAGGNIVGEAIPLQLVAMETLNNVAIKSVPPAYTNAQLVEGELLTAVFYDANGSVVSKQQMIVEHTSWIIQPNASHKYITSIDLESPFISPSNGNLLQFPLNLPISGLDLVGVVTYSDGSSDKIPVNNTKFSIYGLEGYMSSQAGQEFDIVLKYTLGPNESSMVLQVGNNGQISKVYQAATLAVDNAYSFKLYGFPQWQSQALGYGLQWFLYDMNRNINYDVSDKVVINTNFEPWQPKAYGILQTLNVSIDVSLADPSFKSYVHAETAQIVLNGIGDESGYYPWSVAFTPGQNPRYSAFALGTHQLNNTLNWELDISNNVTTLDTWLKTVYYPTVPLFDSNVEKAPPAPTHFNVISNGVTTRFPVSAWNSKIAMGNGMPEFTNIIIEFVMETNTGDLQLSVAAMPVIDTGLVVNNLNNNNTVIGGNGVVIPQPAATAFSIQCLETVGGVTTLNNDSSGNAQNLVMGTYLLQAIPILGYAFANWSIVSGAGSCQISDFNNPNATVFIDGNVVLQANYTTKTATVQAINGAGGLETTVNTNGSGAVLTLPIGQYPITATAETGFQFVNWTFTGNCAIIDLAGNAVPVVNNPDGSIVPGNYSHNTGTETLAIYGPCTVTANYSSTNVLVNIGVQTDTGGTDTATTVSLTGDKSTTLNSTVTGSSIQTTTNYANYTLSIANLDPSYTFVNWVVEAGKAVIVNPNSQNTQVSISGPVTINAIVKTKGYKVTFATLPGFDFSTGMTFNGQPVTANSSFTVPAGTYPIFAGTLPLNQFSIWTGTATYVGDVTNPNCQVAINGDTVITPEFVPYSTNLSLNINLPYIVTINGQAMQNGSNQQLSPGAYPITITDTNGNPVSGSPAFSITNQIDPSNPNSVQVSEYAGATLNFTDGCTLDISYSTTVNICTFSTESKSDITFTLLNQDGSANPVATGANKLAGGFMSNTKLAIGQSYGISAAAYITDVAHEAHMNFVAFETSDTTGAVTISNKNDPANATITFNDNSYNFRDIVIYAIYSQNYSMLQLSNAQQIWTTVSKTIPNGAIDDFTWLSPLVTGQEWSEGTGYAQFGGLTNAPMCIPVTPGTYTINAVQPYQSYQGDMSSEVFNNWILNGQNATLSSTSTPLTTLTVSQPTTNGNAISIIGTFSQPVLSPATLHITGYAPTNGTITIDSTVMTGPETVQPGNHVLKANPADGYKFQSWTLLNVNGITNSDGTVPTAGNPAGNSLATLNLNVTNGGDYGINANFVINSFNLNFAGYAPDNGSITVDGQTLSGGVNLSIGSHTVTAVPAAGYVFVGWKLAGPSTNAGVTNSDGLGFTAGVNNTSNPTITINGAAGAMYAINALFSPELTVTFPATPNVTWVVDNATGNNNATNVATVIAGSTHSIQAELTAEGYTVAGWTANPASAVTFTNGTTGSTVQYVATANCTITPLVVAKTTANVTLLTDTSLGSPNTGITTNTNGYVFGSGSATSTGWTYNGNVGQDVYEGIQVGIYPITLSPPTAGFVFDHWVVTGGITIDNPNSPNATVTIIDDGTIQPICKAVTTVTVSIPEIQGTYVVDNTNASGAAETLNLVVGATHTLTAQVASSTGYYVDHWASNPISAIEYTNGGNIGPSITYSANTNCTLTPVILPIPTATVTLIDNNVDAVYPSIGTNANGVTFGNAPASFGSWTYSGSVGQNVVTGVAEGTYPVTPSTVPPGYAFDHWAVTGGLSVDNINSQNANVTISGDGSIQAIMKSIPLVTTFQLNGSVSTEGSINLDGQALTNTVELPVGKHTLVATPAAGYSFANWLFGNGFNSGAINTDGSAFDPTNPNITIDTTNYAGSTYIIGAVWNSNTFEVVLNGDTISNGTISVDGQPLTDSVTLTNGSHNLVATPAAGYTFGGWTFGSGDTSGVTNTDGSAFTYPNAMNPAITMNGSGGTIRYVNAIFNPVVNAVVAMPTAPSSNGIITVDGNTLGASQMPVVGAVHNLVATPASGYTFAGWLFTSSPNASDVDTNGLVDTDGTVYNSLNPNVTLTLANGETRYVNALWTSTTFTIAPTTSPTPAGTITIDGVQLGSAVQQVADGKHNVLATPGVGYTFGGWQINDTSKATNSDGTAFNSSNPSIIINGNGGDYITVNAIWNQLPTATLGFMGYPPENGSITIDGQPFNGSASLPVGQHTLVAVPAAGYGFSTWVLNNVNGITNSNGVVPTAGNPASNTTATLTLNVTDSESYGLNAQFVNTSFSVGFAGYPPSNGSISVDGTTLTTNGVNLTGGTHTVTAIPAAGYVFTGWNLAGSATNTGVSNSDGFAFAPGVNTLSNPTITINGAVGASYSINATFALAPVSKVPKTLLMMNMDTTPLTDAMGNTIDGSRTKLPAINTTNPIVGTGSAVFTGTEYIGVTSLNTWNDKGSSDDYNTPFTVECKFNSTSNVDGMLVDNWGTNGSQIEFVNGYVKAWYNGSNFVTTTKQYNDGNSHHAALVSDGTNVMLFVDGTKVGSTAVALGGTNGTGLYVAIGCQLNGGVNNTYNFVGMIDDVRIVHGAAVYTTNFAPNISTPLKPIYAYDPTVSYSEGDAVFSGTSVYYAQSNIVGNANNTFVIGTDAGQFALTNPNSIWNVTTGATNGNATVAINGNNYSSGGSLASGTYSLTAIPTAGYGFNGWTVTSGSATIADPTNPNTTVTINGNCSILANVAALPTVSVLVQCANSTGTVSLNGDSNSSPNDSQTLVAGGTYPISFTPSSGNQFNGWQVSSGTGITFGDLTKANTTITIAANATNSVLFANGGAIPTVNVLVQSTNASGLVSINGDSATGSTDSLSVVQSTGGTYPINFVPNQGYTFTGWSLTSGTGITITDPTSASTTIVVAPGSTGGYLFAAASAS